MAVSKKDYQTLMKSLKTPVDWQLLAKVGDGSFGSVYKVRNTKSGQLAAVKIIETLREADEVIEEINILKKLSNQPNIIQFIGAFKSKSNSEDQLWLVMELCRGGSVTALVKQVIRKGSRLSEEIIAYVIHEILKGLEVLHERNVLHRDIKGTNILLTSNAEVKIVDFGVSAQTSHSKARRHSSVGTPYWMSPEVIACDQQYDYSYDTRCDIWSLGITAIELADGKPPLADEHPMRALFKTPRNPPPTVSNPHKWSLVFNDFISKCLIKDFERRPTVKELLKHNFLKRIPQRKREIQQTLKSLMLSHYGREDGVDCDNIWYQSPVGAHPDQWRDRKMLGVDDLASLENLTEESILTYVMERYLENEIYTYIGDILIAVNPFKQLPIYHEETINKYFNVETKDSVPPHIFAIASSAYTSMIINQEQQCCLISGESGAGKTVSSNFLLQYLAELGKSGNRMLKEKILQVNPLLEALGNATTDINDNSSRFGKYLELQFTTSGHIVGASLADYLLEKSRVVSQSQKERNFHIFYYFLAGLWRDGKLNEYSLKVKGTYKYLQSGMDGLEEIVFSKENQNGYNEFKHALHIIGFTSEEMLTLFGVVAAIIHIGEVEFTDDDSDLHMSANSQVRNHQQLQIIASLLGVRAQDLSDAFTTSSNVTRGETISRKNTVEQSQDCRDAMAKSMYHVLFTWIVDKINHLLAAEVDLQSKDFKIGILDIFGFENFARNSFEQLFINIANEQIQHYFNKQIFTMEMNEYQKEGIPTHNIVIKDNKHMVNLFMQRPIGLLALLDEECGFPKASDMTLIDKFSFNIQSECYAGIRDIRPSFVIKHYPGEVLYDATGFLEKNRDTMSSDIIDVLRTSENTLLRTYFSQELSEKTGETKEGRSHTSPFLGVKLTNEARNSLTMSSVARKTTNSVSRRQRTLSMTFRVSLEDLLFRLKKAKPHFVRCIKPNDKKMADLFDQERVMTQLKYTGVLETTRLRKEGYSERITFQEFVRRYQLVLFQHNEKVRPDALSCKTILRAAGLENWLVGKTKIFLKYYHVEKLTSILEKYRQSLILVQRVVRAWLQRRRLKRRKDKRVASAIILQKVFRGIMIRKRFGNMLNLKERKAITIQAAVRGWLAVRKYRKLKMKREESAIKLQSVFRAYRVKMFFKQELQIRKKVRQERRNSAAIKINAVARGHQARKEYDRLLGKSSQMETKMIYFLQQVSHLCEEFYKNQRELNKPVDEEDRKMVNTADMVSKIKHEMNAKELDENGNMKNPLKLNDTSMTSLKKISMNDSGYRINPILLQSKQQLDSKIEQEVPLESFIVDTTSLRYRIVNSSNDKHNDKSYETKPRKLSINDSSDIILNKPSNDDYVRRQSQRSVAHNNVEVDEVLDVTDLRAKLRRTGNIDEGSGLHRLELVRENFHRIIDVQ